MMPATVNRGIDFLTSWCINSALQNFMYSFNCLTCEFNRFQSLLYVLPAVGPLAAQRGPVTFLSSCRLWCGRSLMIITAIDCIWLLCVSGVIITSCRRAAATICPRPRPATEARSGSLEPGRPSRARSANTRHPAGFPHTPPADRMYVTDVRRQTDRRQTASSLNAPPGRGHN